MLHVDIVGSGSPALLLLHGLGVNGAVWHPLLAALRDWPGRIVIPDFRGHGRSPHRSPYGIGQHAADVAALFEQGERVHIVGHSMGGQVGLLLASGWYGVRVEHTLGFGLKVNWSADEIAKVRQVAAAPLRSFDTRAAAAERFVRVAGLAGVVDAEAGVVEAGIVREGERYRLAADPATVLVAGVPMAPIISAIDADSRYRLACGDRDPLVRVDELMAHDASAIEIADCGHNPHVEKPQVLAQLIPRP
jgi:pimeloyl-ACP methyl ester carboxylesterase